MDRLEQLNHQLSSAIQQADMCNIDTTHHKVSPIACELAKSTNPYLTLLKESHERFEREYGRPAQLVYMPMAMLMPLVGDLPQMEQQLFWVSETKKIEGMEVKLSQDGTLKLV